MGWSCCYFNLSSIWQWMNVMMSLDNCSHTNIREKNSLLKKQELWRRRNKDEQIYPCRSFLKAFFLSWRELHTGNYILLFFFFSVLGKCSSQIWFKYLLMPPVMPLIIKTIFNPSNIIVLCSTIQKWHMQFRQKVRMSLTLTQNQNLACYLWYYFKSAANFIASISIGIEFNHQVIWQAIFT